MKKSICLFFVLVLLVLTSASTYSQFIEDALRYINFNNHASPRAAAFGLAYFGFSDDAACLTTNPAGLTLVPDSEMAIGLNLNNSTATTNFFGSTRDESKNKFNFTNVQFVLRATPSIYDNPPDKGGINWRFGFSYNNESDFTLNSRYTGFNTQNTFIAQQADQRASWLYNVSLVPENFQTNIQKDLQQSSFTTESGGLHNLALGVGVDLNETFSVGGSLLFRFGTYNFSRRYFETDIHDIYNQIEVDDLLQLSVEDKLTQESTG
jgi:hypothetical protein